MHVTCLPWYLAHSDDQKLIQLILTICPKEEKV